MKGSYYNKLIMWWILLLCALFFSGCGPSYDYVQINGGGHEAERLFVESLFADNEAFEAQKLRLLGDGDDAGVPSIFIDFYSGWEREAPHGDILISRSVLVPRENALAFRGSAALAACLDGTETLVAPDSIAAPFVALRVDGLALGDEGYPLVWEAGISVRTAEGVKATAKFIEKMRVLREVLESAHKPLVLPLPAPVWIAAGGDTMLDRGASDILLREGPAGIFGKTAEMLATSDLSLINLEGVVSSRGERVPKSFNFRFSPDIAPALRGAGIDAVLHANNHVYDYGPVAFVDSLSWLDRAGIGVTGAGMDDTSASAPFVFTRGSESFRVFGIASFPRERNGWDGVSAAAGPGLPGMLHSGRSGAEKLKERFASGGEITGDGRVFNIVLFHGGVEWSTRPDAATRALYTGLIEAGADLVIGSHPHIVQGFEWVLGKPVFWSLGNYVFGGMDNTDGGEEGLFIRLGFLDGQLLYLEPFALILTHTRTDIAPPEKLETFYARSRELGNYHPKSPN